MINTILQSFKQQRQRGRLIQQLMASNDQQVTSLLAQEAAFNRQVAIVALTGATAAIHIALGGQLFVLNGVGYLSLLCVHLAVPDRESYRTYTRNALLGYTSVTVIGYIAVQGIAGFSDPLGIFNKLIELGLLNVLWEDRGSAGVLVTERQWETLDASVQPIAFKPIPM